ncbi:MAG: hypothetical protein A6F71_09355 [Cycloclasticus sp. symbiont of Poecilosclerida sp. M]|nr:MAG: hypothetical protein A6F71_09355 [Cycloclasticus sp. symbiont of Poecilosclerida sp. M]
MGKGRTGIETISALLDLPPPVILCRPQQTLCGVLKEYVCDEQIAAASRLKTLYKDAPPDAGLDITVTFDGTLSKRGFTALYGVGVVVSWVTGEVIDTELACKYIVVNVPRILVLHRGQSMSGSKGIRIAVQRRMMAPLQQWRVPLLGSFFQDQWSCTIFCCYQ